MNLHTNLDLTEILIVAYARTQNNTTEINPLIFLFCKAVEDSVMAKYASDIRKKKAIRNDIIPATILIIILTTSIPIIFNISEKFLSASARSPKTPAIMNISRTPKPMNIAEIPIPIISV